MDRRVRPGGPGEGARGRRGWRLAAVLAATSCCALATIAGAAPYGKGDTVTISGRVSDVDGAPVASVTVLLELSRNSFSWRKLRRVRGNTLQIPVISAADGQYRHDWRWDGFYNTFELVVALPVPAEGGEEFEVVRRFEITQPVMQGSPVTVPLVIRDARYLGWLRRFSDGSAGAEEKRVFRELGKPDRIDFAADDAAAWWYFAAGKVYRFAQGALEEVEAFDPIEAP